MLSRRELFAGGALFAQGGGGGSDAAVVSELQRLRQAVTSLRSAPAAAVVARLRDRQRVFLRTTQRFPERIDVGIAVWEGVQDWHLENRREIKVGRSTDGYFEMEFLMTSLVLRPEYPENEIGVPYDRR